MALYICPILIIIREYENEAYRAAISSPASRFAGHCSARIGIAVIEGDARPMLTLATK